MFDSDGRLLVSAGEENPSSRVKFSSVGQVAKMPTPSIERTNVRKPTAAERMSVILASKPPRQREGEEVGRGVCHGRPVAAGSRAQQAAGPIHSHLADHADRTGRGGRGPRLSQVSSLPPERYRRYDTGGTRKLEHKKRRMREIMHAAGGRAGAGVGGTRVSDVLSDARGHQRRSSRGRRGGRRFPTVGRFAPIAFAEQQMSSWKKTF